MDKIKDEKPWDALPKMFCFELTRRASKFVQAEGAFAKAQQPDDVAWASVDAWVVCEDMDFEAFSLRMRELTQSFGAAFDGWVQSASTGLGPQGEGKDKALALSAGWTLLPRSLDGEREEKTKEEFVANEEDDWARCVAKFSTWAREAAGAERVVVSDGKDHDKMDRRAPMRVALSALRERLALSAATPEGAPARKAPGL